MDGLLLLVSRVVLFAVLLVSALAKLLQSNDFRASLEQFGVPAKARKPLGLALPIVELGVAVLLLPGASVELAGTSAAVLIGALNCVVGWHLLRGKRPDCNCFGAIGTKPIGPATLARNLVLFAMALGLAAAGERVAGMDLWMAVDYLEISTVLTLCCLLTIVLVAWLVFQLLRQQGRVLVAIDNIEQRLNAAGIGTQRSEQPSVAGLPAGTTAPRFDLPLLARGRTTLQSLLERGLPVLLLFVDPQCTPCKALLPRVADWQTRLHERFSLLMITAGTLPDNKRQFGSLDGSKVAVQQNREVAEAYWSAATPSAVLVGAEGAVLMPAALGAEAIAELVESHFEPQSDQRELDVAAEHA